MDVNVSEETHRQLDFAEYLYHQINGRQPTDGILSSI